MDQPALQDHAAPSGNAPSVLRLLNCCSVSLERLLGELRGLSEAEPALRALAAQVLEAIALDADIALASILLNRIAGTYPLRHCVETALVATLVARATGQTPQQTLIIAAAALTMNVAMLAQHDSFQRQSTALTRAERDDLERHPKNGADLLQGAGVRDQAWIAIVMQHHEMDDGSGYPEGKIEADIVLSAVGRIPNSAGLGCDAAGLEMDRAAVKVDASFRTNLPGVYAIGDLMSAARFRR